MIVLEEVYVDGVYKGKYVILEAELTPEFIKKIKDDVDDAMGWRKYHGVLDRKARKKWRT